MIVVDLDIETYSTVELKKSNVYAYVEDPEFEIMMCGIGIDDGPIEVIEGHSDIVLELKPLLGRDDVEITAHNAGFERVCFSRALGMPVGDYLPPEQWLDTAAIAALHGLPRSLDALARAFGATPKDSAGTRLINLFCKPNRGKRVMPHMKPEEWAAFLAYCAQDVGTMREVRQMLRGRGWPEDGFERRLWCLDQRINDRGMQVDLTVAERAVKAAHQNTADAEAQVIEISGVDNPGSTQQLGKWCADQDFPMENWQAETVKNALGRSDVPEPVQRVLELRQELALVAHRKFEAVLRGVSMDGRLRGQFMYHAAHTGRWSSKGVQVHNLPRLSFEYKDKDGEKYYDEVAEDLAIQRLRRGQPVDPTTLKKMVRPMIILDGVTSDFSAIEARVLAWIAGEDWVCQAFLEGRDLYVENAERMGGGMERPDGKIAVLAGGYQGSVGSFRNMGYGGRRCPFDTVKQMKVKDPRNGREYDKAFENVAEHGYGQATEDGHINPEALDAYLDKAKRYHLPLEKVQAAIQGHAAERQRDPNHKCDIEIKAIVDAWRDANPMIREFWYDMERKFWTGGVVGAGLIRVEKKGTSRWIHLPSGRILKYRQVHRQTVKRIDPETNEVTGTKEQIAYRHVQGYIEKTYGGRLTENVTQAVARDLLADALLRLDEAGYLIVGHVHDEALVESMDAEGIREIMRTGPAWAEGLPLDASADVLYRYRKG